MEELSKEDSLSLTKMIIGILESWGLNTRQQHTLLAFSKKVPVRGMRRFLGDHAFPDEAELNNRVEHIVGIHHALHTTYPHNPAMGALWIKTSNKRFNNQSPIKLMLEEGIAGVERVRTHLDCAYDWQVNP
ncbi:hypothetical protein MNBD_GAMMA23-256 [hydrothermal vent metagenome]|uniref:Antitoxin Xre/MbcA/ParS-like toxin-binding domain-containing protein n=1 Tax=hydrothermal vent metagenome TaxID=652676 RepID=A0A3B0ZXW7_9ZZZZ